MRRDEKSMEKKRVYIRIRVSPKTPTGQLLRWTNKKGLTGWELFSRFVATGKMKWDVYHFRKEFPKGTKIVKPKY